MPDKPNGQRDAYQITPGENQLLRQLRDIMDKMGTKPYQVSVLVVDGVWHIYEGVPRGRVKQ